MNDLHGKIALVTGGAQGIGKGIARRFLELGMAVVIGDSDGEAGNECVEEYGALGGIRFVETDVSSEASVERCIGETIEVHGHIDVLINNAGIADPGRKPMGFVSLEEWNRMIGTNLTGVFLMVKHAASHLRRRRGAVVNIASTRAFQSEAHTEAYSASKGGIVALTHAMAISLGPHIRVNCISPGWIEVGDWKKTKNRVQPEHGPEDMEQHPVGRVGMPRDIASVAAFLVSDSAGFITGQNFIVDGGMTRKMIYADD